MKSQWLSRAILHAASLLVPGGQRADWLTEWRSELWYVPRCAATQFCLGAFHDAFWVRRNSPGPTAQRRVRLESPLMCLAFLAALAVLSFVVAVLLPPRIVPPMWRMRPRDLAGGSLTMFALTCVILPATRLAMGGASTYLDRTPWPCRLRRGMFLALKIALVQPIMLSCLLFMVVLGPLVPFAPSVGLIASWVLTFRWILRDQRQRCPVCLRLLTSPVRIGSASDTFLEWYGAESVCSRGHGLLQVPEITASYCRTQEWLRLDSSWSPLFARPAGAREP